MCHMYIYGCLYKYPYIYIYALVHKHVYLYIYIYIFTSIKISKCIYTRVTHTLLPGNMSHTHIITW